MDPSLGLKALILQETRIHTWIHPVGDWFHPTSRHHRWPIIVQDDIIAEPQFAELPAFLATREAIDATILLLFSKEILQRLQLSYVF